MKRSEFLAVLSLLPIMPKAVSNGNINAPNEEVYLNLNGLGLKRVEIKPKTFKSNLIVSKEYL